MNENSVLEAVWNWRQPPAQPPRRFLAKTLILCVGLAVAAAFWWYGHETAAMMVAGIAAAIFLIALILPKIYVRLETALAALAHLVGLALSWLFLTPVFYLCFSLGHLSQILFRRDPMRRRLQPEAASYWRDKPQDADPSRYRRQYL